jgi:hypothetical protein
MQPRECFRPGCVWTGAIILEHHLPVILPRRVLIEYHRGGAEYAEKESYISISASLETSFCCLRLTEKIYVCAQPTGDFDLFFRIYLVDNHARE